MTQQVLSSREIADLVHIYREEQMACRLYRAYYRHHRLPVFKRIAGSEARHVDRVAGLLGQFGVATECGCGRRWGGFRRALDMGLCSVDGALRTAVSLEMADIDGIAEAAARSSSVRVRSVLAHLGGGSFNHVRAFARQLLSRGGDIGPRLDAYISRDELESPHNLAYKIFHVFQAKGIPSAGPLGLAVDSR